jgi:hypothetical protein
VKGYQGQEMPRLQLLAALRLPHHNRYFPGTIAIRNMLVPSRVLGFDQYVKSIAEFASFTLIEEKTDLLYLGAGFSIFQSHISEWCGTAFG